MQRRILAGFVALVASSLSCTDVSDPDGIGALQFDGAPYPSVVVGDSLRDSLGIVRPLVATALSNDGNPLPNADVVFSSPDTVVQIFEDGVVYGRRLNPGGAAVRLFASVGSLQSQPASLFVVPRADSIARAVEADTTTTSVSEELAFSLFGDTAAIGPKVAVPGWLVSFQLKYRGVLVPPTDTTVAYSWTGTTRRILSIVDTSDASGRVGRRVAVQTPRLPEDTIFLVATARRRRPGTTPLTAETRLIIRQGASSNRVP